MSDWVWVTRKPQSRLLTADLIHIGKWLAQTSTHSAYSNHHENRQNEILKEIDKKIMKHGTNKWIKKRKKEKKNCDEVTSNILVHLYLKCTIYMTLLS